MDDIAALLREQVRHFAARRLDALGADRAGRITPEVRGALAEIGAFGVTIPEAHGGAGLGLAAAAGVVAELARADRSTAVMVGLHLGLGTRALVERGDPALQRRWLPDLAEGRAIASFAATESGAGSDLTELCTQAELHGGELVLRGEKSYVTNGGFASCFTVLAQTPGFGGARAHSLLFVPRALAGVAVGSEEHKLGIRASSTVTVRFEDVRLPLDHVLGEPGQGLKVAHRALEWGRCIMSAGCVGIGARALDDTVRHVGTRRQFGKPLLDHPAVRAQLGHMASRQWVMEALVDWVAERDAAGEDIALPSALAKVFASEAAFEITDLAVQLHGALGVIEDAGIALLARDCRVTRIFEGANDVLLQRIGVARVGSDPDALARLGLALDPALLAGIPGASAQAHRLGTLVIALRRREHVRVMRRGRHLSHIARATLALVAACRTLARVRPHTSPPARVQLALFGLVREAESALSSLEHDDALSALDDAAIRELLDGDASRAAPPPQASLPVSQESLA